MRLLSAYTKHRVIATLCVLIGTGAGIAAGVSRKQVYSATASVNAGSLSIFAQAVPGFVSAAESLATTYSRLGASEVVLNTVSRMSGLPVATLASRIYVVPVQASSVMTIGAQGPTPSSAVRLANQELKALTKYIARLASSSPLQDQYLSRYRQLAGQESGLAKRQTQLRASLKTPEAIANSHALSLIDQEITVVTLQQQALANAYTSAQDNQNGGTTLSVLARARTATSDRKSTIQQYGVAGAVGGLLVAFLFGLLLEQRRTKREDPRAVPGQQNT